MDKNRAIIALVVIVFVIVVSMLYVIFASNRQDVAELADVQTFEEGHTFDIDNDINNRTEDKTVDDSSVLSVDTIMKKDNVENESQKTQSTPKTVTATESSPETGPGSIAAVIALVLGTISAGVVYKKQDKEVL